MTTNKEEQASYLERVNPMATIAISEAPIAVQRGRKAKPNEYLPHIASFDDGQTRTVTPTGSETVAGELTMLRNAAKTIERSVSVEFIGGTTAATATAFKFALRSLITRTRKDAVPDVIATEAAKTETKRTKK